MTLTTADATTQEGAGAMAVQQLGNERTIAYTEGPELVMERVFDAPRELVWKVMNDPDQVTNWWGPRGHSTTVEQMDLRVGGQWRWVGHTPDGQDVPFKGEYLEVDPPARLVYSEIYDVPPFNEGGADSAAINTVTYEDVGGRTKVVARSRFPSVESLDGALATGMIGGALEAYDRLGELIAEEAAKG
jgi:uncharacterized protein YndB with AHSA1/START domain